MTRLRRAAVALLCAAGPAGALSPRLALRQFLHDSWTEGGGGIVKDVFGLAQSRDGYLWVGGTDALWRFDGVRFSSPPGVSLHGQPPGGGSLTVFRDGSVWAARKDRLLRWRPSAVESYPYAGWQVVEAADGAAFVLQNDAVVRLDPQTHAARRFTAADGLPAAGPRTMAADPAGGVWLGVANGVCRWTPGAPAQCYAVRGDVAALAAAPDGSVYAATPAAVVRIAGGAVETVAAGFGDVQIMMRALLVDRAGVVWLGSTSGLLRIRGRDREWFTRKDGLSSNTVLSLAEDAEGDLWIGTSDGLDRLRNPRVLHLTSADGLSADFVTSVAAAPDGAVWIGMSGSGLDRWRDGRFTAFGASEGLPARTVLTLAIDPRGAVWAGTQRGVARFENGRFRRAWPGAAALDSAIAIAADASGAVWIVDQRKGLWRVQDGRATNVPTGPFPHPFRIAAAPDGAIWLAAYPNGIASLRPDGLRPFDAHLGPDAPRAILADRSGQVWIGAGRMLARIRNGKATVWGPRQGIPPGEIHGIADDGRGNLWTVGAEAVARIPRSSLDGSPDGDPRRLDLAAYDQLDGLRLKSVAGVVSPRIAAAADGRIWVPEQAGVAILDPEVLRPDTVPPPVHVEQITVDGAALPPGVRRFRGHETRIAYTALSLRAPERVRFRYSIEPGAAAWTDAEGRREVTFVNLPPDRYRFRVTACNLDNVCNAQGEVFDFDVIPYFYQTPWAKLLYAAVAGLLFFLAYRLRLGQMRARFRVAAQERARVTREIHDTLLQGFAGVVYQLEAASRQFESQPAASKSRLERAISQADNALTEARKTLQDMRLPVLEECALPEALRDAGANAAETISAAFAVRTKGRVAPLPYPVQAAMFLIGREAINNAVNHARPARITVHLIYGEREFRMIVHDDGIGFDPEAGKQKPGHFGVSSMEERARQAGAEFRIDSAPGRGTTVTVTVGRK